MRPLSSMPLELVRRLCRAREALQPVIACSLEAEGLSKRVKPGMGLVLFTLYEEDGRSIQDIAWRGHVSHVAVLQLVARIEKAGLVRRRRCPHDRRVTRVWLTPLGRSLESRMHAVSRRNRETLTRILGVADASLLNELLERLLRGLADEMTTKGKSSSGNCTEGAGEKVTNR